MTRRDRRRRRDLDDVVPRTDLADNTPVAPVADPADGRRRHPRLFRATVLAGLVTVFAACGSPVPSSTVPDVPAAKVLPPSSQPSTAPTTALSLDELLPVTEPSTAVRVEVTVQVAEPPPTLPPEPWAGMEGTHTCRYGMGVTPCCPQWWGLAIDVGWPLEQMATLDYVMGRESKCDPGAYNGVSCGGGAHAIGLTQLCGWGGKELFDARANLTKALELWQSLGWHPWCMDAVTGRC